jgi:hypothetical protein
MALQAGHEKWRAGSRESDALSAIPLSLTRRPPSGRRLPSRRNGRAC